jgi:hypothetical protein
MPLKLYLQDAAPTFSPTIAGTWNNVANAANQGGLFTTPSGAAATLALAEAVATNPFDVLLAGWNGALAGDQVIQGQVNWVFGLLKSNSLAPFTTKIHIWVSIGSTNVARGTLLNNFIGTAAWPTTAQGLAEGPFNLTPVQALNNDCIVIEVGYRKTGVSSTSRTGTINYGSSSSSPDLSNGDTSVTVHPSWINFSNPVQIQKMLQMNQAIMRGANY